MVKLINNPEYKIPKNYRTLNERIKNEKKYTNFIYIINV
mgnify:FL=1